MSGRASVAVICVFCASSERIAPHYVDLASRVGAELARRGHSLVTGGGSVSCMGAVARAARAEDGIHEGVERDVGIAMPGKPAVVVNAHAA